MLSSPSIGPDGAIYVGSGEELDGDGEGDDFWEQGHLFAVEAAWPAIQAAVRAHARYARPCVVDGWGILPAFAAGLGLPNVAALFLIPDAQVQEQRCRAEPTRSRAVPLRTPRPPPGA